MPRKKISDKPVEQQEQEHISDIDEEISLLENTIEKRKRLAELREKKRILDIMDGTTKTIKYVYQKRGLGKEYNRLYTLYDETTLEPLVHEATLTLPLGKEVEVRADVAEQILKKVHDEFERVNKDPELDDIQPWIIEVPNKKG